jgi:NADH:ubiquinone oxidoreductase subunit F (NADH-binding)
VTTSACTTVPGTDQYRVLGHPADLSGHLQSFGRLPMPTESNPAWADSFVATLAAAGLEGRGGGAFPTAAKLGVARAGGAHGVMVVNGMEGEPASDKDKVLLTMAPHLVLDGAQLLARVFGADWIVVCVPAGRDVVAGAVERAMAERAERVYAHVPESVVRPPDRFVAGEESALARWIDTGRSLPSFRPDKSVALHIGRRPVLVHNTETLAHVALIARRGPEAFRERGMPEEPGSTLVTISGAVAHQGVVEVDRGTPLDDIIARAVPVEPVGALLVGGYSGTWVGAQHLGTPYASIPMRTIGAAAGVGVVVVHGESACGVTETARLARYMAGQSSGQCGPCVHGLPAIADDLARLAAGRPDAALMPRLHRRLEEVDGRGACRHPDGVVGMVRSALHVFATDVDAHLHGEPCAFHASPTRLRFPHPTADVPWR